MTSRPLGVSDLPMLQRALDQDEYEHLGTKNFTMDNSFSEVYEDEKGPIGVLRCTKTIRMVCVWCDNDARNRNAASVVQAVSEVVRRARAAGFTDIIFETESPNLKRFCEIMGFKPAGNTMVLNA